MPALDLTLRYVGDSMRGMLRAGALIALMALCLAVPASVGAAPDDIVAPPPKPQDQQQTIYAESDFDQWVFQNGRVVVNRNGRAITEPRGSGTETALAIHIDEVDRTCSLSDEQREKLKLAAKADSLRFSQEVDRVRRKFLATKRDDNARSQMWQEIQELQKKATGDIYGEGSVFAKSMRTTLSAEQLAQVEATSRERSQFRYRAAIAAAFQSFDGAVPLLSDQREKLITLVLEKTPPPAVFGRQDMNYVFYQLSTIPGDELKEVIDQRQWMLLSMHLSRYGRLKQSLIQQGVMAQGPSP